MAANPSLDSVLAQLLSARGVPLQPGQSVRAAASLYLADRLGDSAAKHEQLGSADSAQLLREVSEHLRKHQVGTTPPPQPTGGNTSSKQE